MKNIKKWIGRTALAAALSAVFALAMPAAAFAEDVKGMISVSGSGAINIAPDVAYITLGVSTQDASPKVAQDKNNKQIASVIASLQKLGIDEQDIKTSNYYMYPNYDYQRGENIITGYNVNNNVTVTVRDIEQAGDVLSLTVDAGANVSSGVQFGILDSTEAYNKALELAIENAAAKAKTIAKALGKTIGEPIYVSETGGMYMPVYASAQASYADKVAGVPVQAGELTVTANVQISYEYDK